MKFKKKIEKRRKKEFKEHKKYFYVHIYFNITIIVNCKKLEV